MLKINGYLFGHELFRNNEGIYKEVPLNPSHNHFEMVFEDNRDITNLIMAHKYVTGERPDARTTLYMPYIPYSRMDRKINEQIFSLAVFASVINDMNFDEVLVVDPHSSVSKDLIHNLVVKDIEPAVLMVAEDTDTDVIMFPDKGARNKYVDTYKNLCKKYPVVFGEKERNLKDRGHIAGYKLLGDNVDVKGKKVLIVDDLCVYGNTFKFASIALREHGASAVNLWIAHCENAINDGPLFSENHIDMAFTTNSMVRNFENERLITVEL